MSPTRLLTAVSSTLGLVAAGLLTSGSMSVAAASPASVSSAAPPTLRVYVARNHTIAMPQRMRPGLHKFVVRSARPAAFQLVQAAPGYSKREALRDVFRGLSRGNTKAQMRFERNVDLLGGVQSSPGEPGVLWTRVPRGKVWALDTNARRNRPGQVLTLRVGGPAVTDRIGGGAIIRAINDADWARGPRRISHNGRLSLKNDSTDNHFVELVRLAEGKTIKDFARWVRKVNRGQDAPPPVDFSAPSLSTGVISPGRRMTAEYDLPRGRYVLVCFWPDAEMGGMPHAFMGMFRAIRLT